MSDVTIWKYPLHPLDEQVITGPALEPLSVGHDPDGQLCIWGRVTDRGVPQHYTVNIVGTGNACDHQTADQFLGSVTDGPFVWHVFVALIEETP